jgi:hypothetical protein
MRTLRIAVALATVAAMTGLLPAAPASAAVPNVLTYGGGFPVLAGQNLSATLAPFTTATFTTGPGGAGVGTTCITSNLTATVLANPLSPGTANVKVLTQTFGGCTSTIPGVTLPSVVINNLPYQGIFNDAAGLPVTIAPIGPPIQITINETFGGGPVVCVWQLNAGAYHGNYANAGSKLLLINQQDHIVAGPGGACAAGAQFINVTYAPFLDTSVGPPNQVSVN